MDNAPSTTQVQAGTLITNAGQLVTCVPAPGNPLGIIEGGCVAIQGNRIVAVGSKDTVAKQCDTTLAKVIDATGKTVVPGFVDCHTHLVFGGSRRAEYAVRLTTNDPEAIQKACPLTGLEASMAMTREASEDALYAQSAARLSAMIQNGTTTIEIKSGYGLNVEDEMKQLRVIQRLAKNFPVDIMPTFLGAHAWPANMPKAQYIELLLKESIPAVAASGLAVFCDIWCDDGFYDAKECETILKAGLDAGLKPKIHTDGYSYIGGSDLAADMGMVSADHLNYTPPAAIEKMVKAGVTGVVLPTTDFAVNHPKPFNPRPMLDAGLTLALGTNCNPGVWVESMAFVMMLATRRHAMTPAEALLAATIGGAKALGLSHDRGTLEPGKLADVQIWHVPQFEDAVYRLGVSPVETVIKNGEVVA